MLAASAVVALAVVLPGRAKADPCSAILCLGGSLEGTGSPTCAEPISEYFSIVVFDFFGFDPVATAAARLAFLEGCPEASFPETAPVVQAINIAYGEIP
jgi:hypothetical protein